jgi:hypothetical protein
MTEQIINIDLRYLAESQPSLCIPRVFNNISEPRIRQVFDELGLGRISGVDIKERKNEKGDSFKRVYIHFEKWFWNENAQSARKKLVSGKEIKIVYDNPWFWKVSASKWTPSREYEMGATNNKQQRTHILDDFQIIDDFDRELSSYKQTRKEYDDTYKRISAAKERFYDSRERNNYDTSTSRRRDSRERENYDRRDEKRESYDRRDEKRESYDRRDEKRENYNRRDEKRESYDRRDEKRESYDRRDTRDRNKNDTKIVTPTLVDPAPSVPLSNQMYPKKRFKLQLKKKPETLKPKDNDASLEIKEEKVLQLELEEGELEEGELEEGELEEVLSNSNDIMTEERKEILKDLYGDI